MNDNPDKSKSNGSPFPEIPKKLPILPNEKNVLYPYLIVPAILSNESIKKLIEEAVTKDRIIGVFTVKQVIEGKTPELYSTGTAGIIHRMLRVPDGSLQILIQGMNRINGKESKR